MLEAERPELGSLFAGCRSKFHAAVKEAEADLGLVRPGAPAHLIRKVPRRYSSPSGCTEPGFG